MHVLACRREVAQRIEVYVVLHVRSDGDRGRLFAEIGSFDADIELNVGSSSL